MKELLAITLGLVLALCGLTAIYLLLYGTGYLAVVLWGLIAGDPPEALWWTTYWTTGFLLIVISMVGISLWKAGYEEVCNWFGWH